MYNEPRKLSKWKKIELVVLIVVMLWSIIFLINYIRYSKSKSLFMAVKVVSDYTDGKVVEYYSLGYVYRSYNRNSIKKEELVPFWVLRKNVQAEDDLPQTYSGYNVPENIYHSDKYKGLLYFYDGSSLVGTYKCINTKMECTKAVGGKDEYDVLNNDYLTKREPRVMDLIYGRYAFVDDSSEQEKKYGDIGYFRTVYLLDVEENKIIARYSDVKESAYNEVTENAIGDDYKYIVKDEKANKWGIIKLGEDGAIDEVLPFVYKSIMYDEDTGYYILNKDNLWYVYDLNSDKKMTGEVEHVIYDVWYNSNKTLYYKVAIEEQAEENIRRTFKIYRYDGMDFLVSDDIFLIMERKNYLMYLTLDKNIHFIDYAKEEKKKISLNFTDLTSDSLHHPAFTLEQETSDYLILYVYDGPDLKERYRDYLINTVVWD